MNQPEILAPVGGHEQLLAAVRSGADAVYLGTKGFNARRNAENFDGFSLGETVGYCHARNVRVYVTVNTLVMDSELKDLYATAEEIAESGADAVILQDLAANRIFRDCCPSLPRHASTQMVVHNLTGARMLEDMGFSVILLARELSLREMEHITKNLTARTEVFVHGAHCMCVSGGCYLSSMLGERSGNRGLCAQPCRLDFQKDDRHYALSLKDMSYFSHIRDIADIGVSCLKIEGRMKRPEYVAASVSACRKALSGEVYDEEVLRSVFSRSGFTDGYLTGRRTLDMFGYRTKEDVVAAAEVLSDLERSYKDEVPVRPVDFALTIEQDQSVLKATCDGITVDVPGAGGQEAKTAPTGVDSAMRSVGKTGGTPFYARNLTVNNPENRYLSMADINAMRRDAIDRLLGAFETVTPHEFLPNEIPLPDKKEPAGHEIFARFEKASQLVEDSYLTRYILPVGEIQKNPDLLDRLGDRLIGELPSLAFGAMEDQTEKCLQNLFSMGLKKVVADNIYGVLMAKNIGLEVLGGWGLNILNSIACEEYARLGLSALTVSFELSMDKIRELRSPVPFGILTYGYLPLMRMRACPAQGPSGCGSCDGHPKLTDRLGISFPLLCQKKQYTVLLNSVPMDLADKSRPMLAFEELYFTIESPSQIRDVLKRYRERIPTEQKHTNGLYFRELK